MSDDKVTIRVPEEQFEKAKSKKEVSGQTWGEYIADEGRGADLSYDDIKEACMAAIREELTVTEMGANR